MGTNGKLELTASTYLVLEYCEHDLSTLVDNMRTPFAEVEIKCLLKQLLRGIGFLHDNWIVHRQGRPTDRRDIKCSNLLLNHKGELKLCDFGLARLLALPLSPLLSLPPLPYSPPLPLTRKTVRAAVAADDHRGGDPVVPCP